MENMEAIVVTFQEENQMPSFRGLSRMEKLRLLMVLGTFDFQPGSGDSKVPELDYLSNELYLLEWNRFPFKKFPSSFVPYNLVELKLIESNLQRLWNKSVKVRTFELPIYFYVNLIASIYNMNYDPLFIVDEVFMCAYMYIYI